MTMFAPIYYLYLAVIDSYMHMHFLNRVEWLVFWDGGSILVDHLAKLLTSPRILFSKVKKVAIANHSEKKTPVKYQTMNWKKNDQKHSINKTKKCSTVVIVHSRGVTIYDTDN